MYAAPRQERIGSAVAAGVLTAAIGWALLNGLAGGMMRAPLDEGLAIFRVAPPPPRPAEKVTRISLGSAGSR